MNEIFKGVDWLFFDIGSTLVDETDAYDCWVTNAVEALAAQGISVTRDTYLAAMIDASRELRSRLSGVMTRFGHHGDPLWFPKDAEKPYPSARPLLELLRGKYKIGIIANQSPGSETRLRNYGLWEFVDVCVASAEFGVSKPDLRIFQAALEQAQCPAERAVMIGDRLDNDIAPAKKLGMRTVWVRQGFGGYGVAKSAEYEPDVTVDDLSELLAEFE
jgi:HAD superfamily hydrolase (TIGR01509 family)